MSDAARRRWSGDTRPLLRRPFGAGVNPFLDDASAGSCVRRLSLVLGLLFGFWLVLAATADQAVADPATPASSSQLPADAGHSDDAGRPASAGSPDGPGRSAVSEHPPGAAATDTETPTADAETPTADIETPEADAQTADAGAGPESTSSVQPATAGHDGAPGRAGGTPMTTTGDEPGTPYDPETPHEPGGPAPDPGPTGAGLAASDAEPDDSDAESGTPGGSGGPTPDTGSSDAAPAPADAAPAVAEATAADGTAADGTAADGTAADGTAAEAEASTEHISTEQISTDAGPAAEAAGTHSESAPSSLLHLGPVVPVREALPLRGESSRTVEETSAEAVPTDARSMGNGGTTDAPDDPAPALAAPAGVPAAASAPTGPSGSAAGGGSGAGHVLLAALFGHHDVDPPAHASLLPRPRNVEGVIGGTNDPGARPD